MVASYPRLPDVVICSWPRLCQPATSEKRCGWFNAHDCWRTSQPRRSAGLSDGCRIGGNCGIHHRQSKFIAHRCFRMSDPLPKMTTAAKNEFEILTFPTARDWERWLAKNTARSKGVWLQFFKKGS